jgi:hypothetical protein
MLDDLLPETPLADVQLNEMPGLHNQGYYFLNEILFFIQNFKIN